MVRKISVSDQAYELLNRLREELGTATHSETILVLAERARLCSEIEPRLRKLELLLLRLLEELTGSKEEGPESPAGAGCRWRRCSPLPRVGGALFVPDAHPPRPRRGFRAPLPRCL